MGQESALLDEADPIGDAEQSAYLQNDQPEAPTLQQNQQDFDDQEVENVQPNDDADNQTQRDEGPNEPNLVQIIQDRNDSYK